MAANDLTSTDGKVVSTLQKPITRERQAVWSISGDLVAGWISKYDVGVFSARDGNLLQVLKTHTRKKLAIQRFFDFGGLRPGIHFSPNGRTILTIFGDTEAELWDVKRGIRIYTFDDALRRVYHGAPLSREPVNDGEISPDGRWVYTSSYEGGRIWDLETGRLVNQFDGFQFAHFSPDGMYLGPFNTKGSDATQVLDLQTMKLRPLGASFAGSLGIWSPDGRWIITDRTIDEVNRQEAYFFQVDSGEMLWSTKTYAKYCVDLISTCISDSDTFTFSPNSRLLAVSNMKSVKIVDSQSGDLLKIVDGVAGPVAWNPDSRLILCRRAKGGELLLYEIQA